MLTRLIHALVLGVIFFGLALMLIGLSASAWQAANGFTALMGGGNGLDIPGARLAGPARASAAGNLPAGTLPNGTPLKSPTLFMSPTPFMPVTSTAWPVEIPASGPPVTATPQPSSTPVPTATATRTPRPVGPPDRLIIEKIALDAPVVIIPRLELQLGKDVFEHWQPPAYFAAGWHEGSAFLGEKGNTVLSGHHNIAGMVFARLLELERGDQITVKSGENTYHYIVTQVMYFEERFAPLEQRIQNAHWILPSDDERLTLVTCWPPDSNTYRLIIVAVPDDN